MLKMPNYLSINAVREGVVKISWRQSRKTTPPVKKTHCQNWGFWKYIAQMRLERGSGVSALACAYVRGEIAA